MQPDWDPEFHARSALFEPLCAGANALRGGEWPDCTALNAALAGAPRPVVTAAGRPLRCVAQAPAPNRSGDGFEQRIFLRGEMQVRPQCWHDLFNVMAWLAFPDAKAAINLRHYHEFEMRGEAANRGPVQDALTLFDESGVIVAVADASLAALLRRHEWKPLFWERRADVMRSMRVLVFGHALFEKALRPYPGMTGRGLVVEVGQSLLDGDRGAQVAVLDAMVAAAINDERRFCSTRELTPVPVLGVPGWCADNQFARYYDDTRYFRPLRTSAA